MRKLEVPSLLKSAAAGVSEGTSTVGGSTKGAPLEGASVAAGDSAEISAEEVPSTQGVVSFEEAGVSAEDAAEEVVFSTVVVAGAGGVSVTIHFSTVASVALSTTVYEMKE